MDKKISTCTLYIESSGYIDLCRKQWIYTCTCRFVHVYRKHRMNGLVNVLRHRCLVRFVHVQRKLWMNRSEYEKNNSSYNSHHLIFAFIVNRRI